jgi:hypothetical protein
MIRRTASIVSLLAALALPNCTTQEVNDFYPTIDSTVSTSSTTIKGSSGKTNNNGEITFFDEIEAENATIIVDNEKTGEPIANATVYFTNHEDFKLYSIDPPNTSLPFSTFLRKHNSTHKFSLTPATVFLDKYEGNTNEDSFDAAQAFRLLWKEEGCVTASDAQLNKERSSTFLNYANKYAKPIMFIINKVYSQQKSIQDTLIKHGFVQGGECKVIRVYSTNTSAPVGKLLFKECLTYVPDEVCGDNVDNNCDGQIDEFCNVSGKDTVTINGIEWEKYAPPDKRSWQYAKDYCTNKGMMLPRKDDLLDIRVKGGTCLLPSELEGTCSSYWTRDTLCFGSTKNAQIVSFNPSEPLTSCKDKKESHYVRCSNK